MYCLFVCLIWLLCLLVCLCETHISIFLEKPTLLKIYSSSKRWFYSFIDHIYIQSGLHTLSVLMRVHVSVCVCVLGVCVRWWGIPFLERESEKAHVIAILSVWTIKSPQSDIELNLFCVGRCFHSLCLGLCALCVEVMSPTRCWIMFEFSQEKSEC